MPLRDAARGLMTVGGVTKKVLEPAAKLLPEPLRAGLTRAAKSIEGVGSQFTNTSLDMVEIASAARYAQGLQSDKAGRASFIQVVGFGWQHLARIDGDDSLLISETLLANHLPSPLPRPAPVARSQAEHAAGLLIEVRKSPAIGRPPGLSPAISQADKDQIALRLVAIMVWLMSARAHSLGQEAQLLDLSLALALASRAEVLEGLAEPAQLAKLLETAATHL